MSHACPIPGCEKPAKDNQLMCLAHWRRVPKALNRAVFETFATWRRAPGGSAERQEGQAAYRQARDAAIEAVAEKERSQ